ncbi:MAG: 16S rRNA (cytidine(1402)-2'-O)-methyltransferase [Clostridia bacterium]|nr:16S rRNA (cytidine(1402)-2'-O)-methyltransferase [Clostridia bacterium]
MMGTLYLVATPIGNMGDLSPRAKEILESADLIAAEDTRVTGALLKKLGIEKKLVSYYEHNAAMRSSLLIRHLEDGETIALVSDAGTPAISDPGEDIVEECIRRGIEVIPVPGPCAFVCALTVSGFSTKRFSFIGFLPAKQNERKKELESIKHREETLIFYEAPHRLLKTLSDMCEVFGEERKVSVSREITKKFEEHIRGSLSQVLTHFETNPVKGEFVIVAEGGTKEESNLNQLSLEEHLDFYLEQGITQKDAIKKIALDRNLPKREVYAHFHKE